jgi:ABC-type branched-subunit amino acid transport system substrate-binding protein
MRPRTAAALVVVVVVAAAAAAVAAVGRRQAPPLRVAVLADCVGFFRGYHGLELAGAELPFLERGAQARSADPASGVTDAALGHGRRARLLIGCDEGGEFSTLIAETRRLIEEEHAEVVVGGTWPGDGIALGQVARRYPHVTFVAASSGPHEVMLPPRSANLFRIRPSFVQQAAGLGFYAFDRLGWRRAAVLVEDDEVGWDEAATFTAEFCATGGRVNRRREFPLAITPTAARRLAATYDGVVVLSAGVTDPAVLLPPLRRAFGPRRIVVGLGVASDARAGRLLEGVVSPGRVPPPAARGQFAARVRAAFPGLPGSAADSGFTIDFATSVEAVLAAAAREDDLQQSLAHLHLDLPSGRLHVDRTGQGVAPGTLVRHTGRRPTVLARLPPVSPLLGGLLGRNERPGRIGRPCQPGRLPSYAQALSPP